MLLSPARPFFVTAPRPTRPHMPVGPPRASVPFLRLLGLLLRRLRPVPLLPAPPLHGQGIPLSRPCPFWVGVPRPTTPLTPRRRFPTRPALSHIPGSPLLHGQGIPLSRPCPFCGETCGDILPQHRRRLRRSAPTTARLTFSARATSRATRGRRRNSRLTSTPSHEQQRGLQGPSPQAQGGGPSNSSTTSAWSGGPAACGSPGGRR